MKVSANIFECQPMFCNDVLYVNGNFHAPKNTSTVLGDTALKNGTLKLSIETYKFLGRSAAP